MIDPTEIRIRDLLKSLWGRFRIFLCLSLVAFVTMGGTWAPSPEVEWSTTEKQGVKWVDPSNPYEAAQIDSPAPGFYRSPADFPIPGSWTDIQKRRFLELSNGLTDGDKRIMRTWAKASLQTNTQWIDAKADSKKGYIEVTISTFSGFTFVGIEPNRGTVEQDFQGKAKIYNLNDTARYTIWAWDAMGFLGKKITGISNKYIRVLQEHSDTWSGVRVPIIAQKVVEDPNKDLWVSVYQPAWNGSAYQFEDIYSLKSEGDIRSKFRVPLTTSYIRPWLSDLILESNGDLTFSACEDPMGLSSFLGPSYIARLDKQGSAVWTTPSNEISSAICIAPLGDGGYVYGGATFSTDLLYLDKQLGRLCRIDSAGGHTNWGVSGTTYVETVYSIRDIGRSNESYNYQAYSGATYFADLTDESGSCSDHSATPCASAHDENNSTYAELEVPSYHPAGESYDCISWDFGATVGVSNIAIRAMVIGKYDPWELYDGDAFIQGSNDGSTYTDICSFWFYFDSGWTSATQNVSVNYRYFKIRFDPENNPADSAGAGYFRIAEFSINAERTTPGGSGGTDNYYYVAGRNNTGGERIFAPATNQGDCSKVVEYYTPPPGGGTQNCCAGMDGDTSSGSYASIGLNANEGCGWDEAAQTATQSKVWYRAPFATNILLQKYSGGWSTVASTAADTSDGVHLWSTTFAATTSDQWRLILDTAKDVFFFQLYDWQLYPASSGGGIVAKYALSGVTGGTEVWNTKYMDSVSNGGIFNAISASLRDESRIVAVGSTEASTTNLSANHGMALCVNQSGTSIWYKNFDQISEFYDIQATEDGGFLLAGTLYTGTSVQARSAVIMKIDRDGNVDTKFPQTFTEDGQWADGRGVIGSRDSGIIMVGGSSLSTQSISKPYFVKLDRFYRTCSNGNPCR